MILFRSRLSFQLRQELVRPMMEKAAELNYKPNRLMTECVRDCLLRMNYIEACGPVELMPMQLNIVGTYRAVTGRSKMRTTFTHESEFHGYDHETLASLSQKRLKAFRAKGHVPDRLTGLLSYRYTEDAKKRAQELETSPNDFVNRCVDGCLLAMDSEWDYESVPITESYRQLKLKTYTYPNMNFPPPQSPEEIEAGVKQIREEEVKLAKKIPVETEQLLAHCEAVAQSQGTSLDQKTRWLIALAYHDFRMKSVSPDNKDERAS